MRAHRHLTPSPVHRFKEKGMTHVIVVGGGIAGMAAAYRLRRRLPDADVTLIESTPRLGGKIVTERIDGFVIEGGPDTFLSYKPRGVGLCRELGLAARLHGTNQQIRRTYVMRGGRLYDLPEGLTGLVPSRFGPMARSGLISPLGKVRMGLEYFIPPRRDNVDEPLAAFVSRRLGRELYERMIEPLLSGIYAGDGEQLSLAATFPQLRQYEVEHGGLIRGMLAARRHPSRRAGRTEGGAGAPPMSAFVTPESGLAEIVEALEAQLGGVQVRRGTRALRLERAPRGGYTLALADGLQVPEGGTTLHADAVILATPAFATAELVAGLDARLAEALRGIPYVSTATVSLAYPLRDIPRPLDAYGYIIPRAEGRAILACTWTSTKFPHRAPDGWGLIRAFIGHAAQEKEDVLASDDAALVGLVRDELRAVLGVTAAPHLARVFRWPQAMPQYTVGHLERLATIDARLAQLPGVFVAGHAYRGVGVPDCIQSGEQAAEAAAKELAC
jgi:oxygen-dependent protoporphyrinogen oxidase